VTTLGVQLVGHTLAYPLAKKLKLKTQFGVDHYADVISSRAWTELTDLQVLVERSRGQYLNDARYQQGGVFADTHVEWRALSVLAGLRGSWVNAQAKGDPESGSLDVNNQWHPVTGHLGAKLKLSRVDAINLSFDRSFRAPNLDDLTSRQFTGPGFQFENAALTRAAVGFMGFSNRARRGDRAQTTAPRSLPTRDARLRGFMDTLSAHQRCGLILDSWSRGRHLDRAGQRASSANHGCLGAR
jgi:iron complex outermembrane receptor protein/hemoglobin/transferrin/lactoferrin receptor protein